MKKPFLIAFLSIVFLTPSMDVSFGQYRMGKRKPSQVKKKESKTTVNKTEKVEKKKIKAKKKTKKVQKSTKKKKIKKKKTRKTRKTLAKKKKKKTKQAKKAAPVVAKPQKFDDWPHLQTLNRRFNVSLDKLQYWRRLRHGYGEIVRAVIISRDTQAEPGRILQKRIQGQEWGKITDFYDLSVKSLDKEASDVLQSLGSIPEEKITERPVTRSTSQ